MRFERLDIDRYGCFTGQTLDFGSAVENGDLHLVYGPNEAGKSTLRDACIDFLFGFPHQTRYGFRHPNDLLQIGATLRASGESFEGRRVKQRKNSLLGPDGEPVSDAFLAAVVGDVSRASYEQMFSLDEHSLEAGGEEILRSEGDLGALLFSAASGLSSLSGGLDAIRAETQAFYRKAGRSHRLNDVKEQLKSLHEQIRDIDVQAGTYEKLRFEEESKREQHAGARARRDKQAVRAETVKSLLDALEPWREMQDLEQALGDVADAKALPLDWLAEAETLVAADAAAKSAAEEGRAAVARLKAAIDEIEIDQPLLDLAPAVKRLTDNDLEARYRTSQDIDARERELKSVDQDIRSLVVRLGRSEASDPKSLLLPVATVGTLEDLIDSRSVHLNAETAARREYAAADEARRAALAELEDIGDPVDLSAFASQISNLRDRAGELALLALRDRCAEATATLEDALIGLAPWQGDRRDLSATQSAETVGLDALKSAASALQEERAGLSREKSGLEDRKAELQAEIEAAVQATGIKDDAAHDDIVAARDAAWRRHRDGLDRDPMESQDGLRQTADEFETAMNEADQATNVRLQHAAELSTVRRAQTGLAKADASLKRVDEKEVNLTSREGDHKSVTSDLMRSLGLPDTTPLDALEIWLARRDAALVRERELARAETALSEAETELASLMDVIAGAMATVQLEAGGLDWQGRLKRCEDAIADWETRNQKRDTTEQAVRHATQEADRRWQQLDQAVQASAAWETEWLATLGGTWIGEGIPAAVKETIRGLNDLAGMVEKANGLQERIAAMTEDRTAYETEVRRLCGLIAKGSGQTDPLLAADALRDGVADAEEADRRHQERQRELNDAEARLAEALAKCSDIDNRIDEMSREAEVGDLESLIVALKRSAEKTALAERIGRLQASLMKSVDADTFETARSTLSEALSSREAIDALKIEYGDLMRARSDEDAHVTSLYHDWKKAEEALSAIGGDDEVARLEEQRRVLLLEIEQEANAFMRLSAGTALVDDALRAYRETHRSSMMRRASDAFVRITRGAFRNLASAAGKKGEVLVGIRKDGSSIVASEMSRGTRFQLYLALRIAGHAEFAKHRETLPFFADDVLEPFDDDRSAETFALLAEMSRQGQVVYLTHHRHLCDLARRVCGNGIKIHELPDRAVA